MAPYNRFLDSCAMTDRAVVEVSAAEARRIAVAAQGFGPARRGGTPTKVGKVAKRLNAFQIDSVNVLVRAHYMPAYSRLGPYPMTALDRLAYEKRELFEFWGHAACLMPMSLYPFFRWRMDSAAASAWWGGASKLVKQYVETVYDFVADNGPVGASALPNAGKSSGNWWGWSDGKRAIEALFRLGRVAVAGRRNFERLYDIRDRVIPKDVLDAPVPSPDDAKKELLVLAARALGVGTMTDIAGYFHLGNWWDRSVLNGKRTPSEVPRLVNELVQAGRLVPVSVEGWKKKAYVVPKTTTPKSVEARALVSPFDPLMWERPPTDTRPQRLFGFDYKIEIYVPGPKRIYGYYVLPFLLGDRFVGRVDLKADRRTKTLLVPGAFVEPGGNVGRVASELADELRLMASWLELDRIDTGTKGDLAAPLKKALARRR